MIGCMFQTKGNEIDNKLYSLACIISVSLDLSPVAYMTFVLKLEA